jgi:tetratricopeptide (TPR) repeat protein
MRSGTCQVCRLLLCVVGVAWGVGEIRGQNPFRHRVQRLQTPNSDEGPDAAKLPPVPERVREQVKLEERRTGMAVDAAQVESGPFVALDRINLWTPNAYDANAIRYVLMDVAIVNPTAREITIEPRGATLDCDGKLLKCTEIGPLRNYGVQFMSGEAYSASDLVSEQHLPAKRTIAAGAQASVRWVFTGIPKGRNVPVMKLSMPFAGTHLEMAVNEVSAAKLGLTSERIGPQKCLVLVSVEDELDTVNVGRLVEFLEQAAIEGATRAVISGSGSHRWLNDQMQSWFQQSWGPQISTQFSQMPMLPNSLSELHVVVPRREGDDSESEEIPEETINVEDFELAEESTGSRFHESLPDAVQEALHTALQALPPDRLVQEIKEGHRLSRAAALAQGGGRIGPDLLPLLFQFADGEDELLKSAAIVALGEVRDPKAMERLESLVRTGSPRNARLAMESLASSRFHEFHTTLDRALDDKIAVAPLDVIDVLSRFAHPDWNDRLLRRCDDPDAEVRLAALKALRRVGHPQLLDVLRRLVDDADSRIRVEAFNILVDRSDAESEAIAMRVCLDRLKDEKSNDSDLQVSYNLLYRTRDVRAVEPLLARFHSAKGGRSQLLGLLGLIGSSDVLNQILKKYPDLTIEEKGSVLSLLTEQQSMLGRERAIEAISGNDQSLREIGLRYLTTIADPQLIPLIQQRMDAKPSREEIHGYLQTLTQIGGPEARTLMLAIRKTAAPEDKDLVGQMLQNLYDRSPARQFMLSVERVRSPTTPPEHKKAIELCTIAIEMDEFLPMAWASRGNSHLWLNQIDEAARDFQKAVDLDPESSNAMTGLAIVLVRQGKIDDGLKLLADSEKQYQNDSLFLYNSACAYGRAVEYLETQPQSAERDELLANYRKKGLGDIEKSLKIGFIDFDLMKVDPDIASLRKLPEYKKVSETRPKVDGDEQGALMNANPI